MKIPKRIEALIDKRTKLASRLDDACGELDAWLDKNNIETESEDTHGGVEIFVNPYDSGQRIKEAILNHKE